MWNRITTFMSKIAPESRYEIKGVLKEGQLVPKIVFQEAMDVSDTLARSMTLVVVMQRVSWLQVHS